MKASTLLTKKGTKEFVKDSIKDCSIWSDLKFWQEYFLGEDIYKLNI